MCSSGAGIGECSCAWSGFLTENRVIGGPHYLLRFATERTLTINTTAAGGNASLLTLGE
jgi:RHH-type proline utilization regulon transcriptional repressor/proline dehydrogenase/delta 1-pyrroline-5-carboxylate dehydrogenase